MKHARPDYDRFQDPAGPIPADEPVFLLRGQDRLAHMAVHHYGVLARDFGLDDIALASFQHANLMMEWAKKLPDMPVDADFPEVDERGSPPKLAHLPAAVRHLKRGTEYEVVGEAEAQCAVGKLTTYPEPFAEGFPTMLFRDGEKLVVYRSLETGKLWVRFTDEFMDGRFEPISPKGPTTAADGFPHTAETSQRWMESAGLFHRNADFYRGLVVTIGEMFGEAARTSDDGTVQDSVLALKVPGLVRAALAARDAFAEDTKTAEHFAGRMQHWLDEAQRLTVLVRSLGGDPEPGAKQPATPERTRRLADLNTMVELLDAACSDVASDDEEGLDTLRARLDKAFSRLSQNLQSLEALRDRIMCDPDGDLPPAQQELAEICKVLGCITKPGVALQFVQKQERRIRDAFARNNELLRSWDKANPTERQELDCLRRGWGPSTPTERMYRRENVASCLQAIEAAMGELTVSEEESASMPSEAQICLDAAHAGLARHQETIINLLQGITTDPQEWPDIKAAEERGAMRALGDWTPDECQKVAAQLEDAAGRTAEQALVTTDMGTGLALIRKARNYRMIARLMRETGMPAATMSAEEQQITKPPYRPGDCITRRSDGGCFTVALVDGCRVITFGEKLQVPPTLADVELQKAATDEEHKLALLQLKRSGGQIAEKALRFYGDPEPTPAAEEI